MNRQPTCEVAALLAIVDAAILARIDRATLRVVEAEYEEEIFLVLQARAEESERTIARRIAATPVERLLEVAS